MTTEFHFSLSEFITIIIALGGVVSVWLSVKVKIAKIETTIVAMQLQIATYIQTNQDNVHQGFADNKDEHKQISADVKEIRKAVNDISIQIAKLPK